MATRVEKFGIRDETNRTFLVDKVAPKKSVFNIGTIRHNVHSKAMADTFNGQVSAAP